MKRFIILFAIIFSSIVAFADKTFDETKNYQGNNGYAYLGEILEVNVFPELPEGFNKWDYMKEPGRVVAYERFMDYEKFTPGWDSENNIGYEYHYDPDFLFSMCGTERKWLAGKAFKVIEVIKHKSYEYTWIFVLENICNHSDKCYYVYNGGFEYKKGYYYIGNDFNNFPFTVRKYRLYKKYGSN